jgi:hypothetical protein
MHWQFPIRREAGGIVSRLQRPDPPIALPFQPAAFPQKKTPAVLAGAANHPAVPEAEDRKA